ncbi:zinc finger protein 300-like isoform X2 [Homarus americanus]|uniref:zinc finger protein 300-like isoform X2 n=1 Tax=Homarus americanus TaxID=6706 RepID=UPI001C49047C|nr:zinc finger protein 300-like isoform X2 [Homarus americanus]
MELYLTVTTYSTSSILPSGATKVSGNAAQVSIGDTSSVRLGNEAVRPFTFLCCETIVSSEGAIFWHSEEITPDAIACSNQTNQQPLRANEGNLVGGRVVNEFEDVIVKCEDESTRKMDSEDGNLDSILAEEDPLLVDDVSTVQTSITECCTVSKDNIKQDEEISPENKILRKNLVGILTRQDSLGSLVTSCNSKVTTNESARRTKYPETFTCEFCGKIFKGKERAYQFYYHRNREHTHEMIYKCDICSKEFWGEREFLAHMTGHRDQGHICHVCGQKFNAKKNLKTHLLVHLSIREHVCRYCDKTFRRKDHLTVHERIHTGVRPYQCKWCDSAYPQKHQLNLHIRKCPILKRQEAKTYTY